MFGSLLRSGDSSARRHRLGGIINVRVHQHSVICNSASRLVRTKDDDMARRGDPGQNPTLRGRRLAMELQRRREATGMSREEVARQLEWSTSTLFRIETGGAAPSPGTFGPFSSCTARTGRADPASPGGP